MKRASVYKTAPVGSYILYRGDFGIMAEPIDSSGVRYTVLTWKQIRPESQIRKLVKTRLGIEARELMTLEQAKRYAAQTQRSL